MSLQGPDTEALVVRLSHQPQTLFRSVITISDPPRPPAAIPQAPDPPPPPPPNLGALDRLPPELLHEVLLRLDPQSLSRVARTCRGAFALLHLGGSSFPTYRRLLAHAGEALAALARTGLIGVHPVSHLDAALRSQACGTCAGDASYGAFLFLPACERCCWQCMQSSRDRLVVPPGVACKALGLAPDDVAPGGGGVPLMRSIPGRYGIRQLLADRPVALVAVAQALELAASRHGGSEAELRGDLLRRGVAGAGAHSVRLLRRLLWDDGYLEGAVLVPDQGSSLVGRYFGMAAVPLPSLSGAGTEGRVEHGRWCRGCDWVYDRRRRLPAGVVARVVRDDPDPDRALLRLARTAYSTAGFLEHVQHCYGAQELMREPVGED